MAVSTPTEMPALDPRVEFWSDNSSWPRDSATHVFLGRIVHDLGPILYKEWTGDEPSTVLVFPLCPTLDSSTPQPDIRRAVDILSYTHEGYARRADAARAARQAKPMPTPDEWAVACGMWRQISDESWAAYNRYCGVMRVLVTIFELNFVATAFRGNLFGDMRPVPPGWWINECFGSWFATCQVDPDFHFSRTPIRFGGDWVYVDLESYLAWRNAAFRALIEERAKQAVEAQTKHQSRADNFADIRSNGEPASDTEHCPETVDVPAPPVDVSSAHESVEPEQSEVRGEADRADPKEFSGEPPHGPRAYISASADHPTSQRHTTAVDQPASRTKDAKPKRRKPGNKASYDWDGQFAAEVIRRATTEPRPRSSYGRKLVTAGIGQAAYRGGA